MTTDSPFRIKVQGAKATFEVAADNREQAEAITVATISIHKQYAPCKHVAISIDLFVSIGDMLEWQPQIKYLYLPKLIYCDYKTCDKESPACERITITDTKLNKVVRHICPKHISETVENPLWLFGRHGEMNYKSHERIHLLF